MKVSLYSFTAFENLITTMSRNNTAKVYIFGIAEEAVQKVYFLLITLCDECAKLAVFCV